MPASASLKHFLNQFGSWVPKTRDLEQWRPLSSKNIHRLPGVSGCGANTCNPITQEVRKCKFEASLTKEKDPCLKINKTGWRDGSVAGELAQWLKRWLSGWRGDSVTGELALWPKRRLSEWLER